MTVFTSGPAVVEVADTTGRHAVLHIWKIKGPTANSLNLMAILSHGSICCSK